jgi:hypothetical protein
MTYNFTIFTLNETRLSENSRLSFEIPDYQYLQFNRIERIGGGSAIYIRRDCQFQALHYRTKFPKWVEVNAITVKIPFSKPLLLVNIYNPPSVDKGDFITELGNFLLEISNFNGMILIMGDININWHAKSSDTYLLKALISQFNLKQLIKEPTRYDKNGNAANIIDHIYVNQYFNDYSAGTFTLTASDHEAIYVAKNGRTSKPPSKIIHTRNFENINDKNLKRDIQLVDFSVEKFHTYSDPDKAVKYFNDEIRKILNKHAPLKKTRVKGQRSKWLNKEIMRLIQERNNFKTACQKKKSSWAEYNRFKNYVENRRISCRRNYFVQKCNRAFTSSQVWSVYTELSNTKRKPVYPLSLLIQNKEEFTTPEKICDLLADQMALSGTDETAQIDILMQSLTTTNLEGLLSSSGIISAFNSLKPSASNEDEPSFRFLKKTINVLADPYKNLFDRFLSLGALPTSFNCATITPLYKKKGHRTDASNYRGISVLSLSSKILEKCIFSQLTKFVEDDNILDENQHGFRKGRSCETAISLFAHDILSKVDAPDTKAIAVFVDLKKAFDTIHVLMLLQLLFKLNIDSRILTYLCMYFKNRRFQIKLGSFISKLYKLVRGVPQGGILSPLLFALFYNNVGSALLDALYKLFADDLAFYKFGTNEATLIRDASKILESLDDWCKERHLIINFEKTKYIIFHKTQNKLADNLPELSCYSNTIERVHEFRYLGVIFDSNLTFNEHFENVYSRVSSAVGCLMQIKRFVNERTFKILISSFVFSIVDYCLSIWGPESFSKAHFHTKLQNKINSLLGSYYFPQICNKYHKWNKIAHTNSNKNYKIPKINYPDLWEKCNLLSVAERLEYFNALFVFKSIIKIKPVPEITNHFTLLQSTRTQGLLVPKFGKTGKKSVFYNAAITWNKIPIKVKDNEQSLKKFKTSLNKWLVDGRGGRLES